MANKSKEPALIIDEERVDLNYLCVQANDNATEKGFWDVPVSDDQHECDHIDTLMFGAKLALIHSEVSEALEEIREDQPMNETRIINGKPEGFGVELADIVIRVCDIAMQAGVNLGAMVNLKMRYNKTRPAMHGKKI